MQNLAHRGRAPCALDVTDAFVEHRELPDCPPEAGSDRVAFLAGGDCPARVPALAIDLAQQIRNLLSG
ncbi:MAG: hypothetical protein WAN22_16925 [Solirubrobacteraceae bacterium]